MKAPRVYVLTSYLYDEEETDILGVYATRKAALRGLRETKQEWRGDMPVRAFDSMAKLTITRTAFHP